MIDPKKDPARRCMRLAEWPIEDRRLWQAALREGDILDGHGPAAHWRPDTRREVAKSYGRWLTLLERRGVLETDVVPGGRITEKLLRTYLAELREQVAPVTVARRVRDLSEAIRVMDREHLPAVLPRAARALAIRARPSRNKAAKVVPPLTLYGLGLRLMRMAEEEDGTRPDWRASRFRDGLILSILGARAPRRRNLTMIVIGRHLLRRDDRYLLRFEGSEMKNHRASERALPAELTPLIDRYLERWRPVLLKENESDRLWISHLGGPMAEGAIYDKVRAITGRELGIFLNLHAARDGVPTSLALEDPEHVGMAAPLLDHADPRTSEAHYNQADSVAAARDYQKTIEAMRRRLIDAVHSER